MPYNKIKVFNKALLQHANRLAIARRRNMTLNPLAVDALPDDQLFPVTMSTLHNDQEIRCTIVLDAKGNNALLDVPFEIYNVLPEVDAPIQEAA